MHVSTEWTGRQFPNLRDKYAQVSGLNSKLHQTENASDFDVKNYSNWIFDQLIDRLCGFI